MSKLLAGMSAEDIRRAVAERYSRVASEPGAKLGFPVGRAFAQSVGYPPELLDELPPSMTESFTGAGNPQAFVDAHEGERVLDLGCGAGLDLWLYARAVGPKGSVIGLDLAAPMVEKARRNMASLGVTWATLVQAPAEQIPLDSASVDLVTANGIFNLSPDEDGVMREAARVLRPGGRLIFAEIVLTQELEATVRTSIDDWFRCIGGALLAPDMLERLRRAGFSNARVLAQGRNARTGHPASVCAVIRADR